MTSVCASWTTASRASPRSSTGSGSTSAPTWSASRRTAICMSASTRTRMRRSGSGAMCCRRTNFRKRKDGERLLVMGHGPPEKGYRLTTSALSRRQVLMQMAAAAGILPACRLQSIDEDAADSARHRRRTAPAKGQLGIGASDSRQWQRLRRRLRRWRGQAAGPGRGIPAVAPPHFRDPSPLDHNADYGNLIWLAWTAELRTAHEHLGATSTRRQMRSCSSRRNEYVRRHRTAS